MRNSTLFFICLSGLVIFFLAGCFVFQGYPNFAIKEAAVTAANIASHPEKLTLAEVGQFGDSFGPLNALFGLLSIFLLIVTIAYQVRTDAESVFRDGFFRLLDVYHSRVDNIDVEYQGGLVRRSHAALDDFYMDYKASLELINEIKNNNLDLIKESLRCFHSGKPQGVKPADEIIDQILQKKVANINSLIFRAVKNTSQGKKISNEQCAYIALYAIYEHDLAPCYTVALTIFKFVDESNLSKSDKVKYFNLFKGLMSDSELQLFSLYSKSFLGYEIDEILNKYK